MRQSVSRNKFLVTEPVYIILCKQDLNEIRSRKALYRQTRNQGREKGEGSRYLVAPRVLINTLIEG